MKALLSTVFDMSLTASWVILAVLAIRFLLRKAPRKYAYALWSVVAFRLCCPVSFSSALSLFNLPITETGILYRQSTTVTQTTQTPVQLIPNVSAPVTPTAPITPAVPVTPQLPLTGSASSAMSSTAPNIPITPTVTAPVDTAEMWLTAAAVIWCIGIAALLIYAAVSYVRLHRQLATAVRMEGNIYQSDQVRSPFILGFLRPKIYIPFGLDADSLRYVIAHERTHLRRLDHIIKPLSFLLLTIHWFNPLVWLAFFLMSRDMEMSCDEVVLAHEDNIRKAYSTTLLSFAVGRRFPAPSPLAFGETGVKSRIRNVLNWKKPAAWVTAAALLICSIALIACAADPNETVDNELPDPFGHSYRVTDILLRSDPAYRSVLYRLTEGCALEVNDGDGWITIGKLTEFTLSKDNFDAYITESQWNSDVTAEALRKNLNAAWQLVTEDDEMYLLLQTRTDERYLAYGYHDSGKDTTPKSDDSLFLWLVKLELLAASPSIGAAPPAGSYLPAQCLASTPITAARPLHDNGCRYEITDSSVIITLRRSGETSSLSPEEWGWQTFPWSEDIWQQMLPVYHITADLDNYDEKLSQPLGGNRFLLRMDGELWIMELTPEGDQIDSIYSLRPEALNGSVQWEYAPSLSNQSPAFTFTADLLPGYSLEIYSDSGLSLQTGSDVHAPVNELILNDGDTCCWAPAIVPASDYGEILVEIRSPEGDAGCGTICISKTDSTQDGAIYTATVTGTDLLLRRSEDTGGAVISLIIAGSTSPDTSDGLAGSYLSAQCIYMSPYSSYSDTGDSGYRYHITDGAAIITHRSSGDAVTLAPEKWGWQAFPWTDTEWEQLFMAAPVRSAPDISGYAEKRYLPLSDEYFLLRMDGTVWIVRFSVKTESVWSIYSLKMEESNVLWEYTPQLSSRYPAFGFAFDLPEGCQISAYSRNPSLMVRNDSLGISSGQSEMRHFSSNTDTVLYWVPHNVISSLPLYGDDDIQLFIQTPDNRTLEATICIRSVGTDSTRPTYSASITGSDLTLTRSADSWLAVIAPAEEISGAATQAAVQIVSNGRVTTPYFLLSHTTEYVDGQWLSATGQAITADLLTELGSNLPTVMLNRDFRIDHQRSITYGPIDFALYDAKGQYMEEYRYYYGLTFLNWLEQGYYYLTFRIASNGEFIAADDRYESTAWTGIVRIMVVDKLAEPLPLGAKLDLVNAEMRISGTAITVTDEKSLNQLEKTLSKTKELKGGAGCPFGSVLYLTCADGTVYSLCHSEDSCSAIFADGQYYQYSGDGEAFWQLFDPGTGSSPQPDTSEAAQLQLIADSVNIWALNPDYADDRTGYAVTDLDGNGRLELIAANQGGTGNYTYATYYEVNEDCTALEELLYNIPEGYSQPDIMDSGTIPVRWGQGVGNHIYIFHDTLRISASAYASSYHALTLRYGEVIVVPLATCETQHDEKGGVTEWYTDGYGNPITKEEYVNSLVSHELFRNHVLLNSSIHWLRFNHGESILSLDADTLLTQLKESCDNSGIEEFLG